MKMRKKNFAKTVCVLAVTFAALAGLGAAAASGAAPDEAAPASGLSLDFSAGSGAYENEFMLKITCAGADKIYYTLDGSSPVDSATRRVYDGGVMITERDDDKNYVSAVDPVLFDAAYATWNNGKFGDKMRAPDDDDVDKMTVVRAVAQNAAGETSAVETRSYFVDGMEDHIDGIEQSCAAAGNDLAVMSISVNYDDLFDYEKGIYVKGKKFDEALEGYTENIGSYNAVDVARGLDANYKQKGKDWERQAHIDYFESNGRRTELKLSQDCGIRIQGNYSRSDLQKGFRLYARSEYGNKNFEYAFFGDDAKDDSGAVTAKFKHLNLRNGGNCAFLAKFNDPYWQSLLKGMDCETQASRPCAVYLDGEFWGIYILEEDYSEDYFEEKHGVDANNVVIYKGDAEAYEIGYKLDGGSLPSGVSDESWYFRELNAFFEENPEGIKDEAAYEKLAAMVDTSSFMDYFAANIWMNNKWDWPGKNWTMWKSTVTDAGNPYADGKWRLCFYDLDFGGVSGAGDARVNTIKEDGYKQYGLLDFRYEDNPMAKTFAYLMSYEPFRNDFLARLSQVNETIFEKNAAIERCTRFLNIYKPLYEQNFERFFDDAEAERLAGDAENGGYGSYSCMTGFIEKRGGYIQNMADYVNDCYKTGAIDFSEGGSGADENEENAGGELNDTENVPEQTKALSLKITAKAGKKQIKVKTQKNASVKITASKKIILKGKKTAVKSVSLSSGKKGVAVAATSKKLKKGMTIKVNVTKDGYKPTVKKIKVK